MADANMDSNRMPPSLWAASAPPPPATTPLQEGGVAADLVVIGAGFTGLSAALHAAQRGARVIVLEAAEIGWGASGRNNGLVIPAMTRADPDLLTQTFGTEKGERLIQLIGGSADHLFGLVRQYRIDCEAVQQGWIQPAHRPSRMTLAAQRCEQWRRRGFDVALLDRDAASAITGSSFWFGGWQSRAGGHINPLAFTRGLAAAAIAAGASIHTRSPAAALQRRGSRWVVRVQGREASIDAEKVIVATHAYSGRHAPAVWPVLPRALLPMRSYQMATQPLPPEIRATILPFNHAMSDTHGDLHFGHLDAQGRLVTGGALVVPYGFERRLRARIGARLVRMFPQLQQIDCRFDYLWHGVFAATPDGVPRFHQLDDGLYTWLGCNGRGVALATAVGPQLAEAALTGDTAGSALPFEPLRPIAGHAIAKRTAIAAVNYYRWRDRRD